MTTPSSIPTDVYIAGSTGQTKIHDFNPGRKSWQMYAHKISTIGDNLIFEAIGTNSEIYFKQKNNEVYKITDLLGGGNSYDDGQAIIIGYNAGLTDPSNHSIAIGNEAAQSDNLQYSIAIGYQANKTSNPGGYTSDNGYNIAIGYQAAGQVPSSAPPYGSNYNNISIGHQAGYKATYSNTINIGHQSGYENQSMNTIGIGRQAAYKSQNLNSIAIGNLAAYLNQSTNAIAIGNYAGRLGQGTTGIAIGDNAGNEYQGWYGIAVGFRAGYIQQGAYTVGLGKLAGNSNQGNFSVAIGFHAGEKNQGIESVAIGRESGNETQGTQCVAIGYNSGKNIQSSHAIAIGYEAAMNNQGANSICIGYNAGRDNQGLNSLAIGYNASATNERSIVLNATGSSLNSSSSDALFIKPIRSDTNSNKLLYNSSTGEITYQPDSGGGIDTTIGKAITGTWATNHNSAFWAFHSMNDATNYALRQDQAGETYINSGYNRLHFLIEGVDQMRLTTTGLGIGNTAPTEKLDVTGNIKASGSITANSISVTGLDTTIGKAITGTWATSHNSAFWAFHTMNDSTNYALRQDQVGETYINSGYNRVHFLIEGVDQMRLTTTGLGIGTPLTQERLHVNGNIILEAYEYNTSGGKGIFFRRDYSPSNTANFYNCSITTFDHENKNSPAGLSINCIDGASICTGSDEYRLERFRVAQNGNVGIGTTSPSEKLEVDGNIKSSGSFLGSDDRLKHNEEDIVNALSVMRKLKPQKYEKTKELKAADFNGSLDEDDILCVEAGFIAQDIQNVPELDYSVVGGDYIKETVDPSGVVTTNTVSKPYYLNYNNILTYNVAATQELDTIVSSLLAEIASLKERISALEN